LIASSLEAIDEMIPLSRITSIVCLISILTSCVHTFPTFPATPTPSLTVSPAPRSNTIEGFVRDDNGPVAGATVRIQGTVNQTKTNMDGSFSLGLAGDLVANISAWKIGYYCAKVDKVSSPAEGIELILRAIQTDDNSNYVWVPPTGENSCYSCKPGVTQVWLANDAHGRSVKNQRFLTMYYGTDVNGNQSPITRYIYSRDYGRIPLRAEAGLPYYGPGYKLDFPDTAGNCAACHIPGLAIDSPYGIDPNSATGVDIFGIHCDFCHKIADVNLNPDNGLPYSNMPGVLSMDIRRPYPEDKNRYQIFFGTFVDDNVPMEDTYLPLIQQSQFCAPCHFGVFWNTTIYNSYGEWLISPYSDPITGKTCQQCHTPAPTLLDGKPMTNVAPGKGGIERDPLTLYAHTFPGAASTELLQNAVTMTTTAHLEENQLIVNVNITNDKTGHHVPTDSPLRHLILLVQAWDSRGQVLSLLNGSTIPEWGGVGDPARGYYAGLPGKTFAKVLTELWTEITPSGAYWNPTRLVSDNRLVAFATDTSSYTFSTQADKNVTVKITLLFRRAFKALMDQKGWDVPDIIMNQQTIYITP
jgi:hypothetical protein